PTHNPAFGGRFEAGAGVRFAKRQAPRLRYTVAVRKERPPMRAVRAVLLSWACVALLALGTASAGAQTPPGGSHKVTPVDLELVLAVDVSRSIDSDEFELQ